MTRTEALTFTPEEADKLARGWPNLIVPVDGDNRDKSPAKSAFKAYHAIDPIFFTEWPRLVLHRFVRAGADDLFGRHGTMEKQNAAMSNEKLLTPSEALDGLARVFREGEEHYEYKVHAYVYGVEAIAGTDATLARLVSEIEAFTPSKKDGDGNGLFTKGGIADTLAFLLLRASPAAAKSARKRIADALPRTEDIVRTKKLSEDFDGYIIGLDLALDGSAAVKRANTKYRAYASGEHARFEWLEYAADDPAWVLECWAIEPKLPMSVRIVHIAGTAALVGLEKRKWRAIELPSLVRDFGMIRSPLVVDFILSLVGKSSAKDAPLAWFRATPNTPRPFCRRNLRQPRRRCCARCRVSARNDRACARFDSFSSRRPWVVRARGRARRRSRRLRAARSRRRARRRGRLRISRSRAATIRRRTSPSRTSMPSVIASWASGGST